MNAMRLCLTCMVLGMCLNGSLAAASSLRSPLDDAGRPFQLVVASDRPCPAPPSPVRDLPAVGYYVDAAGTVPDEGKRRQNRRAVKELDRFTDLVLQQSDRFMSTRSPKAAHCALELLHQWATAGALEGKLSLQGEFHRNWATNAFATAYLIVRSAPEQDPGKKDVVTDWLERLCTLDQALATRVSNNHLLWCAASCATAAIASGNGDRLDWAVATAKSGLDEVTDRGALPREVARGPRALAYHNFALEALVVVAEMAGANGNDLYAYKDGALRRLADFVTRNALVTDEVAELAGAPQSWSGATSGRFVWAEPYYRRFADPHLKDILAKLRPLRHAYFGGDATLMYGVEPLR